MNYWLLINNPNVHEFTDVNNYNVQDMPEGNEQDYRTHSTEDRFGNVYDPPKKRLVQEYFKKVKEGDLTLLYRTGIPVEDDNNTDGYIVGIGIITKVNIRNNPYEDSITVKKLIAFNQNEYILYHRIKNQLSGCDFIQRVKKREGALTICKFEKEEVEYLIREILQNDEIEERLNMYVEEIEEIEEIEEEIRELGETEKKQVVKVRTQQGKFREDLLTNYDECKICKLDLKDILIAGHIKPWKDSDNFERIDKNNGFLLCPTHDALFDKGLISFENTGKIIVSKKIMNYQQKLGLNNIVVNISKENIKYLEWHRKYLFKK